MKNMKRIFALALATVMSASLCACGSSGSDSVSSSEGSASASVKAEPITELSIGTWWVQYYDSSNTDISDSPDWESNQVADGEEDTYEKEHGREICQLKWDNKSKIEEKYGFKYYWTNLTYEGVKESINTSIMAGSPDCDVYLVDTGMAIPAQVNGLATDLKDVLPEDADIFTEHKIMTYLDLGDGKVCIIKRVSAEADVEATYPLAFNVQMLEDAGLEDPRDLYERGEWTWDKFNEYCQALTVDKDSDGNIDQYGYCGYEYETFENLMMSNGANIAQGQTEALSSAGTGEALQEMYDLYNTYKVCYPYDTEDPSNSMRNQYTQGNIGFFPIAAWIEAGNADYDWGTTVGQLDFDIAYVRWPVGPSGNQETNPGKNLTSGEYYIIPAGCKNPELVYNFLYDYWNWFDGDTSIRDDKASLNWWYGVTGRTEEYQEANFNVMNDCGKHATVDLWNSMNISYDFQSLIFGEVTPAQFQTTYQQVVQDALDQYYN